MLAEWEVAHHLETPSGTLPFNQPLGTENILLQLVPARCSARLPVRLTDDDVPQGDGKIPHRRWRSGYAVHLAIAMLNAAADDCLSGEDLVDALDLLGLHLNELVRTGLVPGAPNGRLVFTPSGQAARMFDRVQLAGEPTVSVAEADALGGTLVEVDLDSALPYYIEYAETQTSIGSGGTGATVIIANPGNTDFFPVFRVDGPTSFFALYNNSVTDMDGQPLGLVYDDTLPGADAIGGGDYVEIDFFRQTLYLNGNQANMKAGVDMRITDFFPLIPGDNEIELVGADALCLSNGAWA